MKWVKTVDQVIDYHGHLVSLRASLSKGKTPKLTPLLRSSFIAISPKSPILASVVANPDFDQSFIIYKDKASLNRAIKNGYNAWVKYPLPYPYAEDAQNRYEMFCGGWLQFFDVEIRKRETDHSIYFEWKDTEVTIYISQSSPGSGNRTNIFLYVSAPGSGDPPPPTKPPPPYG